MANIKPYRSRKRLARKAVRTGLKTAKFGAKAFIVTIPLIGFAGYMSLLFLIRREVKKGLLEEYNFAPEIMGRVFYTALYGKLPFNRVDYKEMNVIARLLSRQIARKPFPIPDKDSIGEFIVKRLSSSDFALLLKSFRSLWGKRK